MFYKVNMFYVEISNWDASKVTDMLAMLFGVKRLIKNYAGVSMEKNVDEMFYGSFGNINTDC